MTMTPICRTDMSDHHSVTIATQSLLQQSGQLTIPVVHVPWDDNGFGDFEIFVLSFIRCVIHQRGNFDKGDVFEAVEAVDAGDVGGAGDVVDAVDVPLGS